MTSKAEPVCQIFSFQDYKSSPDPVYELAAECVHTPVPIVIDNGSFQTRVGWACAGAGFEAPRLLFRSVAARSRGAARGDTQIGNDISSLEPLRWLLKSQFDRNVVVNFEIQELMFDYVFTHLGIGTEGGVEHPVVLTEAPCNPLHSRQMMSELLFECYRVPGVSYGVDSLYSFHHNNSERSRTAPHTGIILSSGYHCSHVLPVINGRLDAENSKRVNVGGFHAASYLQRLLQLKYPGHAAAITLSRMEELLHQHSYTATDYHHELEKWRSPEFYEREVHRMQLPFPSRPAGGGVSAEERQERRNQQLRRLQEINARRREDKLLQDQERLDKPLAVQVSELERPLEEVEGVAEAEMELAEENADLEKPVSVVQPVLSMAEYHQLFVGTERLRVPEILFQPILSGEEQMGLMETLHYVLARYPPELQEALVSNVFLTGGNLQYPGMKERVERELLAMRPFQSHFQVGVASRPALDAWYGARSWAVQNPAQAGAEGWISRQDYEENGGEYLREHSASNLFIPMAIGKPAPRPAEAPPNHVAVETTAGASPAASAVTSH